MPKAATVNASDDGTPLYKKTVYHSGPNSVEVLCSYFSVGFDEFMRFWDDLLWPEKQELIWMELD